MARILFVAKDNGCASVTERIAVLAREKGHHVFIFAEGLAMQRFRDLNFTLHFAGEVDFIDTPFPFRAEIELDDISPDIVVSGLGNPINIQRYVVEEASRRRITLVVCEDFWAKSVSHLDRDKVNPEMILVVDDYSRSLVEKAFPSARVHVVGYPGAYKLETSENVQARMDELRRVFGEIYVYVGGGPCTTSELIFLVKCFAKMPAGCLVPRFNPKYENRMVPGTKKTYGSLWRKILETIGDRVVYMDAPKTDLVVVSADVVISGFSTLLVTALWNGITTVCIQIPETFQLFKEENMHLTEIPQITLGLASKVTKPTDLSRFVGIYNKEARFKLMPYDAQKAYDHICELLPK